MKAVRIHQFGGPEVLTYEDIPDPQPRKDQVLVRVRACSLNHLDIWVRKGLPGVKLPHILGSDVAGEIAEVGEYVSGFKPGQRVFLTATGSAVQSITASYLPGWIKNPGGPCEAPAIFAECA